MLSYAKYPNMNRAQRRDPALFTTVASDLFVRGSALLLALMAHAGFMRPEGRGYVPTGSPLPSSSHETMMEVIRRRGKSIAAKAASVWRKLFN